MPTILPKRALPAITDSLEIDGWSQNAKATTPPVQLNGRLLERGSFIGGYGGNPEGFIFAKILQSDGTSGLAIQGDACEIRGLSVNYFPFSGILVDGPGATIQGNYLGTSPSGDQPRPNGRAALWFRDAVRGAQLVLRSTGALVGGATPLSRNLISGTYGILDQNRKVSGGDLELPPGILIIGAGGTQNTVIGNLIGLNAAGTGIMPKPRLNGVPNAVCAILVYRANQNVIGGPGAGEGNYIANSGIVIADSAGNRVTGNSFGTGVNGRAIEDNELSALSLGGVSDTIIGGGTAAEGNVIGNFATGTLITGENRGLIVQNNFFGVTREGVAMPNGDGISVLHGSGFSLVDNTIAANASEGIMCQDAQKPAFIQRNAIRENGASGIRFSSSSADVDVSVNTITGNGRNPVNAAKNDFGVQLESSGTGFGAELARIRLSANAIFQNGGRAVSLTPDAVSPENDLGDLDSGPNGLLNFPVPTQARLTGTGDLSVLGSYDGAIGIHPYRLEFFADGGYLGSLDISTTIAGTATYTFAKAASGVQTGQFITVTAIDAEGNTSEMSRSIMAELGVDADKDGIDDDLERRAPSRSAPAGLARRAAALAAPLTGDGNGDGLPDAEQANVASFQNFAGQWLTLAGPASVKLVNVDPVDPPDGAHLPGGVQFPSGFRALHGRWAGRGRLGSDR